MRVTLPVSACYVLRLARSFTVLPLRYDPVTARLRSLRCVHSSPRSVVHTVTYVGVYVVPWLFVRLR